MHSDAYSFCGFDHVLCHGQITLTWRWITGRMVMGLNDGRAI